MTDPGLTRRLNHHGRRSGFAIGLSMALAAALLIGTFVTIWGQIDPYLSDFVAAEAPDPTETPRSVAIATGDGTTDNGTDVGAPTETVQPTAPPATAPATEAPAATEPPAPTATAVAFQPSHQITNVQSINLRAGPSRDTEILTSLTPLTPLQFLDERQDSGLPEDGIWMRFRTEDSQEGWVREIDTEPFNPNA